MKNNRSGNVEKKNSIQRRLRYISVKPSAGSLLICQELLATRTNSSRAAAELTVSHAEEAQRNQELGSFGRLKPAQGRELAIRIQQQLRGEILRHTWSLSLKLTK